MANAYLGAGIARGANAAHQYNLEQPERQARRQEATARANMAEQELQEYTANKPVRQAQRDNELKQLEQATYAINASLAKQQSYNAFQLYETDSDTRHLNNWLTESKSNPLAKGVTSGMVRLDKVTRNVETEKMLRNMGITDLDGFFASPELSSKVVLGTRPDGSQVLADMTKMYAATRFDRYTTEQKRSELLKSFMLMTQMRQGLNLSNIKADDAIVKQVAEATGLPTAEVYKSLREEPSSSMGNTAVERVARQLMSDNNELGYRDALKQAVELTSKPKAATNEEAFISDYIQNNEGSSREQALTAYREAGKDSRTSKQKNLESSEQAKDALNDMFDGDFLAADIGNLNTKQQDLMSRYVNQVEQLGGLELSAEDKKNARQIRKLVGLGSSAGDITDDQAGALDTIFRGVKSYISNNVEGKEATAAYDNFRSIARKALFGSQVSAADYKAFNSSVASLSQQRGPVLISIKTQLDMLKDDLEATTTLNDPFVAKARFGRTTEDLDAAINNIQDLLDNIDKASTVQQESSGITVSPVPINKDSAKKKSLDDIFGGM